MKHALIVDDTAVDRRLAGGLVEQAPGVQVSYAKNGVDAMEQIRLCPPDIVVTDMQMPEMGGLELVTQIRAHFPEIPVILMTAQGSEATAVEALERGAASYVPKSQLNERLRTTVEDVLLLSKADQSHAKLIGCQKRAELSFDLENDPALVDVLVDLAQQMMAGMRLTDHTGCTRAAVAVREALLNALYHGNLEISAEDIDASREALMTGSNNDPVAEKASQSPYSDRRIHVDVKLNQDEARFVVEDGGPGFDYAAQLTQMDPSSIDSLESGRGRGFVLMLSFMDEVSFNESGNRVTLVKKRDVG
jgi:CheY-like chemotaxis protein/anti-sigma regulatory factor (Ser/Thr protein kinase)